MSLQSQSRLPADPPTRAVRLGRPAYDCDRRADGSILLRACETLRPYPARMTDKLIEGASRHPDRTLFAARGGDGAWVSISYAVALQTARSIGQALLGRGLSAERPVAILSGNDLDHAMLATGARSRRRSELRSRTTSRSSSRAIRRRRGAARRSRT
jgi:feruloyl-CoA synthase